MSSTFFELYIPQLSSFFLKLSGSKIQKIFTSGSLNIFKRNPFFIFSRYPEIVPNYLKEV